MEGDIIPKEFLMQEAAPPVGTLMTEEQTYYLHEHLDPEIDRIMAELNAEIERRRQFKEWEIRQFK